VIPGEWKRKPGRSRKFWNDILTKDLHNIEIIWDDFGELADN